MEETTFASEWVGERERVCVETLDLVLLTLSYACRYISKGTKWLFITKCNLHFVSLCVTI